MKSAELHPQESLRTETLDSYGILGMRERASSIGATLDITSEPGKGTRVRCTMLRTAKGSDTSTPARSAS